MGRARDKKNGNLRNNVDGRSVGEEVPLGDVVAVDEDGALDGLQKPWTDVIKLFRRENLPFSAIS